jgi:hypothetical protein
MKIISALLTLPLFLLMFVHTAYSSVVHADYQTETFKKLEEIRKDKKNDILSRLRLVKDKVSDASNDPVLLKAFGDFAKHRRGTRSASIWLERMGEMDAHYVQEYGEFYDILFIAADGLVFHSIKMESDFMQNLFKGELATSKLSRYLRKNPNTSFVDYDDYLPSKEPAAFFVRQIIKDGIHHGWIVFQFSINAINSTLSDHSKLGRTGEVYLTNTEKIMISQSRLVPENTSLQLKVDTQAPDQALKGAMGSLLIPDYRGVMVFSSYEKFEFSGVVWIIIAEIDEDEVITDYYRTNKNDLLEPLFENLKLAASHSIQPVKIEKAAVRVDINEYGKAQAGKQIVTYGVATCTAVIVTMSNQYTYLGHIYPLDDAYNSGLNKSFLNFGLWLRGKNLPERQRDLLGSMIERIKNYDVYPYQLNKLSVVLAAVHTNGFETTIDKLLDAGLFLSQITVLHDPEKKSFNVVANAEKTSPVFAWNDNLNQNHKWSGIGQSLNLGRHIKSILND